MDGPRMAKAADTEGQMNIVEDVELGNKGVGHHPPHPYCCSFALTYSLRYSVIHHGRDSCLTICGESAAMEAGYADRAPLGGYLLLVLPRQIKHR